MSMKWLIRVHRLIGHAVRPSKAAAWMPGRSHPIARRHGALLGLEPCTERSGSWCELPAQAPGRPRKPGRPGRRPIDVCARGDKRGASVGRVLGVVVAAEEA